MANMMRNPKKGMSWKQMTRNLIIMLEGMSFMEVQGVYNRVARMRGEKAIFYFFPLDTSDEPLWYEENDGNSKK